MIDGQEAEIRVVEKMDVIVRIEADMIRLIDTTREALTVPGRVGRPPSRQDVIRAAVQDYCGRVARKGGK